MGKKEQKGESKRTNDERTVAIRLSPNMGACLLWFSVSNKTVSHNDIFPLLLCLFAFLLFHALIETPLILDAVVVPDPGAVPSAPPAHSDGCGYVKHDPTVAYVNKGQNNQMIGFGRCVCSKVDGSQ